MNKLLTLLICALLYCSANANVPTSIVVHTTGDTTETFKLTDQTQFMVGDDGLTVVYPEGEYNIILVG